MQDGYVKIGPCHLKRLLALAEKECGADNQTGIDHFLQEKIEYDIRFLCRDLGKDEHLIVERDADNQIVVRIVKDEEAK